MTGKVRFYTLRELFGPQAVRLAKEILYLNDVAAQSKGGWAKADKNAGKIKLRDKKIRAEFQAMLSAGQKRHGAGKKLAASFHLSPYTINKILRRK